MNKKITVEVELSDWAKFVATDEDGEVWEYENKPKPACDNWAINEAGRAELLYRNNKINKNWKDSLIRVEDL